MADLAEKLDGIALFQFTAGEKVSVLSENRCGSVPGGSGVYVVIRNSIVPPCFLPSSGAGWFKNLDPSYPMETVEAAWVPGAKIVYVGKAGTSLRRRIRELVDFGLGKTIGHRGGRMMWHLNDHRELIVRWRSLPSAEEADKEESLMISSFCEATGRLPFANRLKKRC